MTPLRDIQVRATAKPARIVLSEGHDPRIVAGAIRAVQAGFASIVLVGPQRSGPRTSWPRPAERTCRASKSRTLSIRFTCRRWRRSISTCANTKASPNRWRRTQRTIPVGVCRLMVRAGLADGTIGGAVSTTSDTVRAALQVIGKTPEAALVSSFFVMILPDGHPSGCDTLIFSDCALVIDPTAPEMASIAAAAARSCQSLLGRTPRVAMLSFSTKGSALHPNVTKVAEATELLKTQAPDLIADGELQFDTAFVPDIARRKAAGSALQGNANVMVFPNLEAGNIGYKIAQRIGGATAIGPILQGLAKPANDLSRGCTTEDVFDMIAVTTLQAQTRVAQQE